MTNNKALLSWVDEMTTLCQPDKVVWFDGSDAQQEAILADLMDHDAVIKLNEEKTSKLLPVPFPHLRRRPR